MSGKQDENNTIRINIHGEKTYKYSFERKHKKYGQQCVKMWKNHKIDLILLPCAISKISLFLINSHKIQFLAMKR